MNITIKQHYMAYSLWLSMTAATFGEDNISCIINHQETKQIIGKSFFNGYPIIILCLKIGAA